MERHERIRAAIENGLDEIAELAQAIIDERWQQVLQYERSNPGWENRSMLSLRCYRNGNNIRLEWSGIKWVKKTKGKPMRFHVHINRGSGYSYSLAKLSPFAKEWEIELIEKTEEELVLLRREAYHLNRMLISLRHAENLAENLDSKDNLESGLA